MARPQGAAPGLKVLRKMLATGDVVEYFSNRATGESLGTDRTIAEARMAEWRAALVPSTSITTGTLDALVAEYYRTDAFKKLKPRTRETYRQNLEQLRNAAGNMPVKLISAPWVERLKLKLQDQPGKANNTLAVLRIVLDWGIRLGYGIVTNPAKMVDKVSLPPRRTIWKPDQIDEFLAAARPSLQLAFALMLYTAQRQADVLAMTKGQVTERDGRLYIALRQEKTEELLAVPVHRDLEPLLRARLAETDSSAMLVASPTGLHWAKRNFSRAWDQAREKAGLEGLQRRDLRRTAVVLMAQAGVTVGQIAAVTGHRIETSAAILNTYLPRRTDVAVAGMEGWERAAADAALNKVVTLASERRKRKP